MKIPCTAALLISAMTCFDAIAVVTTTVVDLPSGSHTQRFLHLRPDAPVANIVALPGGDGVLDIQDDGTMASAAGGCTPVARVRHTLAGHGFAVALVGANSDGVARQLSDLREVVRYLQQRDAVPTWIIGGSSSTGAVLNLANDLPGDSPVGVIIFSSGKASPTAAALIQRPILAVYHPLDPFQFAFQLYNGLTSATVKSIVALQGGTDAGCGYHMFNGLDAEFAAATTTFIDQNNSNFGPPTVLVVEYLHSAFNHYFITPSPGEIALLDAKTPPFQDWSRTGFSFRAYDFATAPAASVAICRFFNSSFAPKSSHFYAPKGLGCEATIANFPDWHIEDDKLINAMLPDAAGACPAGTVPVYRLYNGGQGGAPNHRLVTSLTERQKMIDNGYIAEGNGIGVGMCAPGP